MSKKEYTVLLIIDSDETLEITREVLDEQSYRVVEARNSNEARLKFANEEFNLVVVDIDMRAFKADDFIEGIRRKERLKNIKSQVPILGISTDSQKLISDFAKFDHMKFLEVPFDALSFKKKLFSFGDNESSITKNSKIIKKDEYLITEGGQGHEMYWVLAGSFRITKLNKAGENIIIGEIFSGELVGEMSFLDILPRSASVKAIEDSEVLVIPHSKFIDVLDRQPRWFRSLMQTMSQRLRESNNRIARKVVDSDED